MVSGVIQFPVMCKVDVAVQVGMFSQVVGRVVVVV